MDYYSAESEFIESLDFLSPPVKRINNSRQAYMSAYNKHANDVHLLSDFRRKLIGLAPGLTLNTKPVKISESSTSLILKKTTEILEKQYSVVSFPSLYQLEKNNSTIIKSEKKTNPSEKPLIKVTVIPKTDSIQAAKLLRRRRRTPVKVQSTTSNHENSIQTKNVFLIVAGRRKEKIYEIKTTGSAKLSIDHDTHSKHDDKPIAELSNFKHLLQSLDMDKKKKKERKAAVDTTDAQQTKEWKHFSECNCDCACEPPESHKRSRLRIFGQFGISEDDKYVLRYGATVNNKEVMSDVAQLTRDFSPIIAETSYGTTEEQSVQQQDSCLKADYNYELEMEKPPVTETVSKETHGTQVNFNVQVGTTQARCASFSDKKTQCSCCGNRSDNNTLKDCQSPMVIISVYPKPSPEDLMKSILCPAVNTRSATPVVTNTYSSNQVLKTEKAPNKSDTRRNYKIPLRSRSPSPVKKVSRPKVSDDSYKGHVSEKRSPDRQKALKAIKDKIREKDKLKQESPRQLPLKSINATQGSKNLQNMTVSNATQVSKRNQRHTTSQASQVSDKKYQPVNTVNATQVSNKRINKNYTATNGTHYSNESNSTQCRDSFGSLKTIAPVKHSIDEAMVPKKYPESGRSPPTKPLGTQVSNATQVPKVLYSTHATQVSRSDPLMNSCATQVSKPRPNAITLRMGKNQETSIPKPPPGFKIEQTPRLTLKTNAESGTNTEQARAKKALVETYTKKLTEQMYQHDYIPARFDNSKVTINIDGDREYYNVLFDQDKLSTGLTIRKTVKDMGAPNCVNESPLGSMLPLSDCVERGRLKSGNNSPTRCPSIVLCNNPSEDELRLLKRVSRLSIHDIRDSLEICHRREDKSIYNNPQTGFTTQLADNVPEESEFSAPIKHFPGDDCSICDPIARDKQIRELLGVKANYSKACQFYQNVYHFYKTGEKSGRRKPTADGDYSSGECSERDEAKLKKYKTEEPKRQPICIASAETFEERNYRRVGKGNVYCKEQLIAKKDMHKLRPELNEEQDAGVKKANVAGKERLIAKKDMRKPRLELNEEQDARVKKANVAGKESAVKDSSALKCDNIEVNHSEVETFVLFNADHNRGNFEDAKETDHVAHTRRTVSSVQIRYASVAYMKQLAYSSTDVGAISDSSLGHLNSFKTLFRGYRKSATPNLGTSAYSLYSADGNNSETKCDKLDHQDSKPKKPFLRRLMSCLVMRSTGDSELKPPLGPPSPPNLPSVNSSIDSYHISTSLAAVEVSSSIYDTSASFYSNHSIHPINSKIKRGFFSSVRGFLTNRKS